MHKKARHQKTAQLKYSRLLAAMRARRTPGARQGGAQEAKQESGQITSNLGWIIVAGVIYFQAVYFNKLETAIKL